MHQVTTFARGVGGGGGGGGGGGLCMLHDFLCQVSTFSDSAIEHANTGEIGHREEESKRGTDQLLESSLPLETLLL